MADVKTSLDLPDLIRRAEAASQRMRVQNPNRTLLKDMGLAIVLLAQGLAASQRQVAELQTQIEEKPRIVCP